MKDERTQLNGGLVTTSVYPSWWQPGPYDFATYPAEGWDCDDLDPAVYPGSGC